MVPILWLNIALMYWAHLIKRGSAIQSSLWISLVRQGGDLPASRGQLNTSSISLQATRRAAIMSPTAPSARYALVAMGVILSHAALAQSVADFYRGKR